MPLRKGWKKAKARRAVLQKAVRDVLDSDGPGGGVTDCTDTLPDEGRDDPTDLTWSVPIAVSAIWPSDFGTNVHTSVLGSNKQMEAKPRLFKPSGPSVENLLKLVNFPVLGSNKQMETKPRLFKPSGPSVENSLKLADLPKDLLDTLPKDLPDDLPKALADDCLTNTVMDTMNEVASDGHNGGLKDCLSKKVTDFDLTNSSDKNSKKNIRINPSRISDEEKEKFLHVENIESAIVDDKNCSHRVQINLSDTSNVYSRGSFSCRSMTFGSFSQSDDRFSIYSRGSQCTMNSLCALIHVQYSSLLNRSSLDEILIEGDQLYKTVIQNLKNVGRFKHRLLCLDEIPDHANAFAKFVNIEKADIVSGIAVMQYDQSSLPTLHQSLEKAFLFAKHVLVMIGAVCSAVFFKDSFYWLFDSHSHGKDGLSSYDGRSILMSFPCLDDLVTFMYAMYQSMSIDLSGQYEILPIKFNITSIEHTSTSDLLSKYFEDQKKRSEKLSDSHSCKHKDGLDLAAEEKNEAVKICIKDRKEYFRKYQQTRRSDREFKVKERNAQKASKRIARTDPLFKEKEKQTQKKSKDKFRADNLFKEKEKQIQKKSKDKFRTDILFKEKEKQLQKKSKDKFRTDILFKEKEKQIQKKSKDKFRTDILFKEKEKQMQKCSKQNAREDILFRENEKESEKKSKAKARKDSFFKEKERCNLNFFIRNARKDSFFKEKEKKMQNYSKRRARENLNFKEKEKEVQTLSKRKAREDPNFKDKEKDVQKLYKRKAREDPTFKDKEKDMQKSSKRKARNDPLFKARETTSQNILKQKARESPYIKEKDRLAKKKERSYIRAKEKELYLDKIRKRQKRNNPDFHHCEKLADLKKKAWKQY